MRTTIQVSSPAACPSLLPFFSFGYYMCVLTCREPLATAMFLPLATARKVRLYEDTYMAVYTAHISGLERVVKGVSCSQISR